jgi:Uma2 family endonuclease
MIASAPERQHSFSFDEYAEVAELSSNRVEFWEGAILDMTGGSPRHSAICSNVLRVLGNQLRGKPCRVFDANLRVRSIAANRATYADATIVCGALQLDPGDKTRHTVLNPSVLIEVQSPSTESDDRGPKLDAYKLIASVRAVILVSQDAKEVAVHQRERDGTWMQATYRDGAVDLPEVGCRLPVAELYEDLPET